jgi:hypothetical protein
MSPTAQASSGPEKAIEYDTNRSPDPNSAIDWRQENAASAIAQSNPPAGNRRRRTSGLFVLKKLKILRMNQAHRSGHRLR